MFDVSKAFDNSSETVSDFFQRPGVGFYIPLYQREYSWNVENIDQLMEDICRGVDSLIDQDNNAIRFLGTIILLLEKDPRNNIKPQDHRALPEKIFNVIDGQQRISTISLLSCMLYQKLYLLEKKLPNDDAYNGLKEAINRYQSTLVEVFFVDLKRGQPQQKPIIIRGSVDGWTFNGDDSHYKSDVSSFLASFIHTISKQESEFPQIPKNSLVGKNLRKINTWLNKVEKAHQQDKENEDFPPGWIILKKIPQEYLWSYERPELVSIVENRQEKITKTEATVCSIIQLLAFSYYLLQRCCFTLIEPKSEEWAFDMFQSLNATGTPLTALETFKPLVVNFVKSSSTNGEFKGSISEQHFVKVDQLFSSLSSASSKNQLTNNYLTLFGLTYDGGKDPSRQFSSQRRWLQDKYNECVSINDKEEFIHRMANLATYWENVINFDPNKNPAISKTEKIVDQDKKQAAICVLYLQNANHKMANTILSRFYSLLLRNQVDADVKFVSACKAIAAFFTLWRSALPNAGLDEIYRKLLREKMSWQKGNSELSIDVLKTYFRNILTEKEIGTQEIWLNKAINYLRYDNVQKVCRFALFITSQDTIPDSDEVGLMKIGRTNSSSSYLEPSQWISSDFKSIEHIAPQKPDAQSDWDQALYDNDDYDQIGNLTLLPTEINSSAGNKQWIEKWIYYRHLAETDPDNLIELKQEAETKGVNLKDSTLELLTKASHAHHIKPIVEIGATGKWDKELVEKRTQRICEILWKRLYDNWLS